MRIFIEPVSVSGKREGWLSVSQEKGEGDKPDIKLFLFRGRGPVVKSRFELLGAKFGKIPAQGKGAGPQSGAELSARLYISVVVEDEVGMMAKIARHASEVLASEVEVQFKIMLLGTPLEIENVKIAWEAQEFNRTIPKRELESVYGMIVSAKIPESLSAGVDSQALLLLELFRGSKISV